MSKYDNLSQEELIKLLEKQEKELASKKYGLVWDAEREPEQVVLDCANNLPVLKRVKGKEIKTDDSEDNILIEGDNYHALTVLNYTHKEKIDVIYIDPPYNTGNKDFIYNDRFVDKTDSHPHSKWLNFMEKRLNLTRNLLKDIGVIFISIDDHEMAQLKLLCDRIFGKDNFVANLVWENKEGGGKSDSKFFRNKHEYILVYAKNILKTKINGVDIQDQKRYKFKDKHKNTRGMYQLIKLDSASIQYSKSLDYPIASPDNTKILAGQGTKKSCWRWSKKKLEWGIKNDFIVIKRDSKKNWTVYTKQYINCDNKGNLINRKLQPIGVIEKWSTTQSNRLIKQFFNEAIFNYSKPVDLIRYLIELSSKKSSIILDFMAGSGTTGHAVLELNKDGGNRKFILCTNNELNGFEKELKGKGMSDKEIQEYGICRRVTYPRIEKVIKGYKKNGDGEKVEGLGGNLQYFKTGLIKKTSNNDQVRLDLTKRCVEMLCVKENIFNLKIEGQDYKIFSSNKEDKFLGVYFNLFDKSFEDFLKEIKKIKGRKNVYVFSLDNEIDKNLFLGIDNLKIEAIPQEILDVYDKMVKMNIPVKAEIIFTLLEKAKKQIFEENDKDDGAKNLRIVLEKILQKVAQMNRVEIYNDKQKEIKISKINDDLKKEKVISQIEWEEIKTYLTIGNKASHGEFDEYGLDQVKSFVKLAQNLINKFNIQ